ncbi:hypothetical protein X011_06580 [Mycobacterium tuberculosis variant microti OV254]|nr:hypothetical protein X011_06580 [Mycobacterium tuberculosis variant microti OV254]
MLNSDREDTPMKSQTKMTLTTFGGAAALALAVGFGGLGGGSATAAAAPATAASVAPAPSNSPVTSDVHHAVFTACIIGLDC